MIRINLVPTRGRRRWGFPLPGVGTFIVALLVLSALGVGGSWVFLARQASGLREKVVGADAELTRLKQEVADGIRFKQQKEDLERRLTLIQQITRSQARPVYILEGVLGSLPNDVWLSGMEGKDGQLKLTGLAFSPAPIAEFMGNLRRTGHFQEVDLLVSKQATVKRVRLMSFEIVCQVGF